MLSQTQIFTSIKKTHRPSIHSVSRRNHLLAKPVWHNLDLFQKDPHPLIYYRCGKFSHLKSEASLTDEMIAAKTTKTVSIYSRYAINTQNQKAV